MKIQRLAALLAVLLGLVVLAFVLLGTPKPGTTPEAGRGSPVQSATAPATQAADVVNPSRLAEIKASELPADGRLTLNLIAKGGPYPYSRDNVPFGNFERILQQEASGYYREFTVVTPGESDRGARRIVVGAGGEKYYTADHYASFRFIAEDK